MPRPLKLSSANVSSAWGIAHTGLEENRTRQGHSYKGKKHIKMFLPLAKLKFGSLNTELSSQNQFGDVPSSKFFVSGAEWRCDAELHQ